MASGSHILRMPPLFCVSLILLSPLDYSKAVESRQRLDSQLQENKLVQDEFKLLKDDANIYKLIGPVLTKQDKAEAVTNVDKRIDFIQAEM